MFRRHARRKPIVTFLNKLNYESLYVNIDMILNSKLQFSKSVYLMLKSFNFIPCLSFRQGFRSEDLRQRSSISKTVLDYLDNHGCLEGMQDENQLSLF